MAQQHFPTAIVGANPLLRESLSRFLQKSAFNVVALASCIDELATAGLPQDRATLLIIDACDHPGDACGQIESFRRDHSSGRIVVLANHCAPADMARVLRSGANGYFATIATCDDFIKSLELVMGGQTILPSDGMASVLGNLTRGATDVTVHSDNLPVKAQVGDENVPNFSARELRILRCLSEGSANKVIARECDIAEGTVKVHIKAILRKLKIKNRTQAAIWALNNRALVWSSTEETCLDPVVDWSTINISLRTQKTSEPLLETAEQVEREINLRAPVVKHVGRTDVITPKVG